MTRFNDNVKRKFPRYFAPAFAPNSVKKDERIWINTIVGIFRSKISILEVNTFVFFFFFFLYTIIGPYKTQPLRGWRGTSRRSLFSSSRRSVIRRFYHRLFN